MIEPGSIAQWSGLVLTGLLFIATLLGHRSRAAKDEVEKIDQRVVDLRQDVEKVKSELDHMPRKDAVHEIMLSLARMEGRLGTMETRLEGRLGAMDARLEPVKAIAERLQEFMLEGSKK